MPGKEKMLEKRQPRTQWIVGDHQQPVWGNSFTQNLLSAFKNSLNDT